MFGNNLTIGVRKIGADISILDVRGQVNAQSEVRLMDAYALAESHGAHFIILNLSELEYMNSSGIGLLAKLLVRVRRENEALLAFGLSDFYRQIFELTRLNEAIQVCAGEPEALQAAGLERSLA